MILSADLIQQEVGNGLITPYDESLLQAASYELTLAPELILFNPHRVDQPLDPFRGVGMKERDMRKKTMEPWGYVVHPKEFLLFSTEQKLYLPNYLVCRIHGKSSLARIGLFIHVTAGFVDPGFEGNLTLQLYHAGPYPVVITAGMKIAQAVFESTMPVTDAYLYGNRGNHYKGQDGVKAADFSSV